MYHLSNLSSIHIYPSIIYQSTYYLFIHYLSIFLYHLSTISIFLYYVCIHLYLSQYIHLSSVFYIHVSIHPSIYHLLLSSYHLSSLLFIIYHLPIIYLLSIVHPSSIYLYQWSSTKGILLLGGPLDNVWRHLGCHKCRRGRGGGC